MAGWRAALLVLGMAATAAAANSTADPFASSDQIRLCGCSDLLWTPQPSAAAEVINWHNKLVQEVTAREADGVRACCSFCLAHVLESSSCMHAEDKRSGSSCAGMT